MEWEHKSHKKRKMNLKNLRRRWHGWGEIYSLDL